MAHDVYARSADSIPPPPPPPPLEPHDGFDNQSQHSNAHYGIENYSYSKSRQASQDRGDGRAPPPEFPQFIQTQRPINEAVTTAFDSANVSGDIDPALIAQITENVIKQLRTSGGSNSAAVPIPPTQNNRPPPPPHQPVPLSPSTHSAASPTAANRNVYTPPSPYKHTDYSNRESPEARAQGIRDHSTSPKDRVESEEHRPPSRVSSTSESGPTRPKGPTRLSTSKEATTLEKIWGQLFDENGLPTARLGQFLRGLAIHMIEDWEPKQSLVVTPMKMAKFYGDHQVPKELYPWNDVFDDAQSSISRMYRELHIEHHLVQESEHLNERPDIPGLTPKGFQHWVTLMIQAHPEMEFERLKKAVLGLPINNPDDKKERFPKDISRRLFPSLDDHQTRDRLVDAMEEHAHIVVDQRSSGNSQQGAEANSQRSFSEASTAGYAEQTVGSSNYERDRKAYGNNASECAIDDTPLPSGSLNATVTGNFLERERKPYRAAPGGGRVYDEPNARTNVAGGTPGPSAPVPPPASLHRASSSASRPGNIPGSSNGNGANGPAPGHGGPPRPVDLPPEIHQYPPVSHHRPSMSGGRSRRNPSPGSGLGPASEFRRSDGDLNHPAGSYGPPLHAQTMRERDRDRGPEGYEEDLRRHGREGEVRRGEYIRGGSPSRRYEPPERRATIYTADEDYYRTSGRHTRNR